MRTCVTGGTGFIGGALVRRLLAEGAHVRALARPSARSQALEARGVEVVQGELADVAAIERAMNGVDTVYHTAAKVSGPGTRQEFFEANVNGTQRVLQACLRQGVRRTVYLSSIAVYGIVQAVQTIDESTPLDQEPEKRDFYAGIDAFALPSRSDSFGIVLLEALANGVPNVGYRAGGIGFVIRDGVDGLLVGCGDVAGLARALRTLSTDDGVRRRLGLAGLERVRQESSWQPKLQLVRETYHALRGTNE